MWAEGVDKMSKKPRRKFTEEQKKKIVEAYVSGSKSASELAQENDIAPGLIYRWKSDQGLKAKNDRIEELTEEGATRAMAMKIQQQEAEIEAYQKKVAELTLINDLLKKLPVMTSYQSESELSGLIGTMKKSVRKQKRAR